jgi:hypothetical protein
LIRADLIATGTIPLTGKWDGAASGNVIRLIPSPEADMPRLILIACLGILITGCVSDADLIAQDRARCTEIGFAADSPDFKNCVLRFQTARIQNRALYASYYANSPPYPPFPDRPYAW